MSMAGQFSPKRSIRGERIEQALMLAAPADGHQDEFGPDEIAQGITPVIAIAETRGWICPERVS